MKTKKKPAPGQTGRAKLKHMETFSVIAGGDCLQSKGFADACKPAINDSITDMGGIPDGTR